MKLIARQNIIGIRKGDDLGLFALNGIETYEAETESQEKLVELFEQEHPDWTGIDYEIELLV